MALVGFMLAPVVLGASGCAGKKDPMARRLKRGEAKELLAMQSLRQSAPTDDEEEAATGPISDKRMEAMGDTKAQQGDMASAVFYYTRALALSKDKVRPDLRVKIASIYLHGRHFPQAEEIFADLVKLKPQEALLWQGLGLAQLGQAKQREAQASLLQAVRLEPRLWKAFNALGILYNQARQYDLAVKAFSEAITLEPKNPKLYNNLGMAYLYMKDMSRAERSFRHALELKPDYKRAANNLGLVYARQKKYSKARSAFRQGSGRAEAHNNVGCFMAWEGDNEQAAEEFREALRSRPTYYPLAGRHLEQIMRPDRPSWARSGEEEGPPLVSPSSAGSAPSTAGYTTPPPWSSLPRPDAVKPAAPATPAAKQAPAAPLKKAAASAATAKPAAPAPKKAAAPPVPQLPKLEGSEPGFGFQQGGVGLDDGKPAPLDRDL